MPRFAAFGFGLILSLVLSAPRVQAQVVQVSGHTVRINVATTDGVRVGDQAEILQFVAEIQEEAHVASGVVANVEKGSVLVTLREASGKVAVGQRARIVPAPRPHRANRPVSQPLTHSAPVSSPVVPKPVEPEPQAISESQPAAATTDSGERRAEARAESSGPGELGVQLALNRNADPDKREGTFLYFVYPGGAAEQAGLRADDVILKVGDESFEDASRVLKNPSKFAAGQKLEVVFQREEKTFTTMLIVRPVISEAQRIRVLTVLAEKGDPRAQGLLGTIYRNGGAADADLARAVSWLTKAAEQDDLLAKRAG